MHHELRTLANAVSAGVMGILNLAHGSLFMLGASLLASLARLLGVSGVGFVAALLLASVAVGLIGVALAW